MGGYFPKVKIILLLEHSSYRAMGCWGIEHTGVWRGLGEMTEDYKDSYFYVRVHSAGRGTKIFDPSKVEFTWK